MIRQVRMPSANVKQSAATLFMAVFDCLLQAIRPKHEATGGTGAVGRRWEHIGECNGFEAGTAGANHNPAGFDSWIKCNVSPNVIKHTLRNSQRPAFRRFETISSGLCRFVAISDPPFTIIDGGPIQWGRVNGRLPNRSRRPSIGLSVQWRIISVDGQFDKTASKRSASLRSIVRLYFLRISTVRLANQHLFFGGNHS